MISGGLSHTQPWNEGDSTVPEEKNGETNCDYMSSHGL